MNRETTLWAIIGLTFVGVSVLGVMTYDQNARLSKIESKISLLFGDGGVQSNFVDPYTTSFGDRVGDMTIISMGPLPDIQSQFGYSNIFAKFKGSVTVTGAYGYLRSDMTGSDESCFTVTDPQDVAKLPRLVEYPAGKTDFCFSNVELAKQEFGPEYGSGQATVEIDNYELRHAPAAVGDMARLVRVVPEVSAAR